MSYPHVQHGRHPTTRLGGNAFNHSQSADSERHYDDLRSKARSCSSRAHDAYERGDGGAAHALSQEAKDYNRQASEFIFRENNAHVAADTIDLHGQFVEEAEDILETRIRAAQQQGQSHLHVIVGKGNHSVNHIQKIKPRVEQVCRELGLQYHTEENEGRVYVQLAGGEFKPPPEHYPSYQHGGGGYGGYPGQQQQQPQYQGRPQQQFQQDDQMEQEIEKGLIKCLKGCCTVM